jgi:hypothetical protein
VQRDACNIARVDNCAVDILRQDGKPKFNKKNYIRIVSPAGNLFPDAATSGGTTSKNAGDTCYIKFLYVALSLSRASPLCLCPAVCCG